MAELKQGFLIRDAVEADIDACLQLDAIYEAEAVWQMTIRQDVTGWEIRFRTERLPRTVEHRYDITRQRLQTGLTENHGFIVAVDKSDDAVFGFAVLSHNESKDITTVTDLLVSRPYRRHYAGTRLLGAARQWAIDRAARHIQLELQTRNYPGLQFCHANGYSFCGFNDHYFPNHDIAVFFNQSLR